MRAIEAVIFDCDGVLIDSEIIAIEVEIAVLAEAGLLYEPPEFTARFVGRSDAEFFAMLDDDARGRLGRPVMAEVIAGMMARKRAAMDARLTEVTGATAMVLALAKPKAVATSSTAAQLERKLTRVKLWDHFHPHLYCADHVERAKPAPDLFLHAAGKLGIAPCHCLVIEDSVNGVIAGKAAGMRVWGFLGGSHTDNLTGKRLQQAGAERLVPDWTSFQSLMSE